ncbi:TetR/AcrR family transcriptional regulator [Actinomycetospora sp. TBRC 11914]|uniref:TetR/AcrR family transcriptional regulator n=1 Tax=Actinomycetospora sp. TBRC 11914 TaxID=2729387 RepID=UPI00145F0B41|nr:TetR/AcrR family transcriptional regulator [Actinomycetospora sp. TBRC 11914]NMO88259.1 TetR/AcrR family transcriptional regulator [Actinomycetospora sp. TBRC 11914]
MARPSRWDDVVRSAAKVFRRRGFARASLEEIADDLGMWKGSLYNYISSKEDLLLAVVKVPADRLLTEVRAIRDGGGEPADQLRAVVRCHVDVLVDIYDFAAVYLYETAATDLGDQWRTNDREYTSMVQQIVEAGIASGAFRPDRDPRLMTMTLLGALNWLTRWWNPDGPLGPDAVADQIADTVIAGIAVGSVAAARS